MSTLSVTNPGTYNGAVGDSVALPIQSGGLPSGDSWTYAATGLPSGLSINTSSGQIGGTIHWLREYLLDLNHGQRRPGRQGQPELHLERVHPVGD